MNGEEDTNQSGQRGLRHLLRQPVVIGALIAGVFSAVAAVIAEPGSDTVVVTAPSAVDNGNGGGGDRTAPSDGKAGVGDEEGRPPPESGDGSEGRSLSEKNPKQPPPPRDGNSRVSAKHLIASKSVDTSINASNDTDWYVYRAPKDETATFELTKYEGEVDNGSLRINVWAGSGWVENPQLTEEHPLRVKRELSIGERIFLEVIDDCRETGGCGIGPYRVVVWTGPAG